MNISTACIRNSRLDNTHMHQTAKCPANTEFGGVPVAHLAHVGVSPSRGLKLFGREIIFEEFQPV